MTPLHSAAKKGSLEVVRLLLESGADIHRKNNVSLLLLLSVLA